MTTYLQALDELLDKSKRNNPICPDCGEEMVKTLIEVGRDVSEIGWIYVWMCGCNDPENVKKRLSKGSEIPLRKYDTDS